MNEIKKQSMVISAIDMLVLLDRFGMLVKVTYVNGHLKEIREWGDKFIHERFN